MCDIKKEDRSFSESKEICSDEAVSQSESVNQDTTTIAFDAKDRPRAIIADRGYAVLSLGDSYYLSTTVKPFGASKALLYKSLDPSVVEVDCMGKIIAKNPGNTIVRVKSGEYPDIYTDIMVCVNQNEDNYYDEWVPAIYVENMELSCDTTTLIVGDKGSVSVMIMPKDVTDKTVSFESSNTSVLICDPYTGEFVAKAPGKAKIIATASNDEKKHIDITVFSRPKAINVPQDTVYLERGAIYNIQPTVFPSTASQKCRIYSEDPMIAQVEEDFSIVANNCGYTTVVISPVDNYKLQKKIAVFVDSVSCDYDACAKATDPIVFVEDPIEKTLNVHNDADVASYPIGPNATAMVDLRDGMLKFDITDFAWEGLEIPMKIHHLYTSALRYTNFSNNNVYGIKLKDRDEMRMGYGWRLNYMPSLCKLEANDIYTFVDIEGNVYRLYPTEDKSIYKDKVDAGVIYNIEKSYIEIGKYRYYNRDNIWHIYDTSTGETEEEQAKIIVTTDNRIEYVKDESGCLFEAIYCDSKLNYIKAPNGNRVECEYDGEFLKKITYPSGEHLHFEYDTNNRIIAASLKNATNACEYMLSFLYDANDKISKVTEYGRDFAEGMSVDYSYDDNVTKLTTVSNEDTGEETTAISTYLFDFDGELIDHYTNHYRCLKSNCKNNNYSYYLPSSSGPTISYERIPSNLLLGHGFDCEDAMNYWTVPEKCQSTQICYNMEDVVHGKGYLKIKAENNTSVYGCEISQSIIRIPAGEYTFSAYVKKKSGQANSGIRLRIKAVDGSGAESVRITDIGMGYVHLFTTFENKAEQKVTVSINVFGDGDFCVDSAQLEVGSSVSDYNVLENGNFMHYVHGWDRVRKNVGYVVYNDIMYSLNGRMTIRKKNTGENMPCQIVQVKSYEDTRTTYTLSGFAKLKAAALKHSDTLKFRLCANIIYVEEQSGATEGPHCEQYIANFSQATTEWQYTSVTFTKSLFRAIDHIEVVCEYYDSNTENTVVEYAYFDSVSLTIGETEYNLTEEDFSICNAEAGYKIKTLKENISKHGNGFSCTSSEKDLETISFLEKFNENHIDIEKILWESENVGNISYSYDEFNNLIAVVCGEGRTYSYDYNQFHKLDRITLSGMKKPLVKYEYKNCNGSLKSATYANGRHVEYTYDRFNRPVRAVWYDANGNIKNDIRHTYNSEDKLVSILDTINRTERICLYEHGKLAYEMYSDGAFVDSNGFKTSGVLSYISFPNVDKI